MTWIVCAFHSRCIFTCCQKKNKGELNCERTFIHDLDCLCVSLEMHLYLVPKRVHFFFFLPGAVLYLQNILSLRSFVLFYWRWGEQKRIQIEKTEKKRCLSLSLPQTQPPYGVDSVKPIGETMF